MSTLSRSVVVPLTLLLAGAAGAADRPRVRDLGVEPGVLPPGPFGAVTDVHGVRSGYRTPGAVPIGARREVLGERRR